MSFGELIGTVGSIVGITSGKKDQKKAENNMSPWLKRLEDSYDLGFNLLEEGLREQDQYDDLLFEYAFRDKARGEGLNDYYRRMLEEDRSLKRSERSYMEERQSMLDSLAGLQRNFEISQYNRANDVARNERQYALDDYQRVQRQAQDERDFEISDLAQRRNQASAERDYELEQILRAQQLTQGERDYEMGQQQDILSIVSNLSRELQDARALVGDYIPAKMYTMDDVENEATRRSQSYMSQVDRAADRVASINEADLIRRGVDSSTIAGDKRAQITAQIAEEYQKAHDRAYDEAMQYITGSQQMENQNYAQRNTERSNLFNEITAMNNPELTARMTMPRLSSGVGPMGVNMRSAVIDGNVRTGIANPNMAIGSGFVGGNISSGASGTIGLPSATGFQQIGNYNYNLNLPTSTKFTAGGQLVTNSPQTALNVYGDRWKAGRKTEDEGWTGLGKSANGGISSFMSLFTG